MDNEKKGFTRGVVYSVAQCFRNGQEGAGELIWHESGFDEDDLAICDDYDADEIRQYYANQQSNPA